VACLSQDGCAAYAGARSCAGHQDEVIAVTVNDSGSLLTGLGFSAWFGQQLSLEERATAEVARVLRVGRSGLTAATATGECTVPLGGRWWALPAEERPTVGDWVVLDAACERVLRVLARKSVLQRMAAGTRVDVQLIAANVDTAFIVTSCNADFNASRLERYLAWAFDAGVTPVLVLTKADLAPDPDEFREAAMAVRRGVCVELVNALDAATLDGLRSWCQAGQTIALVGSSGVGKSTLLNALTGDAHQATAAIREADARGRHTTTDRSLHRLADGAWLLDSPGIRALALADTDTGIETLFDDVASLASNCRFTNCGHQDEPGCAIQSALAAGRLDPRRFANWRKLLHEELRQRETLAERHRRSRAFGKHVRQVVREKSRRRD
jgi:ribosome biogenesis GTPase